VYASGLWQKGEVKRGQVFIFDIASRGKIKAQTFTFSFLLFVFVHPAQAVLNSTPQLFARECCGVVQGAQLGSGGLMVVSGDR
jgi:hypothetical protein